MRGKALGRRALAEIATMVTQVTLLAWHRTLIAQEYDGTANRGSVDPDEDCSGLWFCFLHRSGYAEGEDYGHRAGGNGVWMSQIARNLTVLWIIRPDGRCACERAREPVARRRPPPTARLDGLTTGEPGVGPTATRDQQDSRLWPAFGSGRIRTCDGQWLEFTTALGRGI